MTTHPASGPDPQANGPTGARGVRCLIDELIRSTAPKLGKTAVARIAGPLTEAVIAPRDEVHAEVDKQRIEVVSGERAKKLPEGSLAIRCTEDGEPMVDGVAVRRTGGGWTWRGGAASVDCPSDVAHRFSLFRVLYRGSGTKLAVGETAETLESLGALPAGAIVRGSDTAVAEKAPRDLGWKCVGHDRSAIEQLLLPALVLYLPEDPS